MRGLGVWVFRVYGSRVLEIRDLRGLGLGVQGLGV